MSDVTLDTVTSGYNLSSINANFVKIQTAINDEILHSVGGNSAMSQALDMNSQRIINLPAATTSTEPVTLAQMNAISGSSGFVTSIVEKQVTTSIKTVFTLAVATYTPGVDNLSVYRNGAYIDSSQYIETADDTVTFTFPSKIGDDYIFVVNQRNVEGSTFQAGNTTYTYPASGATPTTVSAILDDLPIVIDPEFGNTAAAFQAAIDAGSTIYLTENASYTFDTQITSSRDHIKIIGNNATITTTSTGGAFHFTDCKTVYIENLKVFGDNNTAQTINSEVGYELENVERITLDGVQAHWYQKGVYVHKVATSVGPTNHNSISTRIDNSSFRYNNVNIHFESNVAPYLYVYGVSMRNTTSELAWDAGNDGDGGTGVLLENIKEINIENFVCQSNGFFGSVDAGVPDNSYGSDFGSGRGLELLSCLRLRATQYHSENHDGDDGDGHDLYIDGTTADESEDIVIDGGCKFTHMDNAAGVKVHTTKFTKFDKGDNLSGIHIEVTQPVTDRSLFKHSGVSFAVVGRGSSAPQGSNYKNGSVIDDTTKGGVSLCQGEMQNFLPDSYRPAVSGTQWNTSNLTLADYTAGVGAHGIIDTSTALLTATANSGYTQVVADTETWDGWKCAHLYLKNVAGDGRVVLYLRNASGDIVSSSVYTESSNFQHFSIATRDTSTDPIRFKVLLPDSGQQVLMWAPCLNDSTQPESYLATTDSSARTQKGIYAPAGIMVGVEGVRITSGTSIPLSSSGEDGDRHYNTGLVEVVDGNGMILDKWIKLAGTWTPFYIHNASHS